MREVMMLHTSQRLVEVGDAVQQTIERYVP